MANNYILHPLPQTAEQQSAPGTPGQAATTAVDFPDGPAKALHCSDAGLATLVWSGASGDVTIANFALQAGPNVSCFGCRKATFTGFTIWPIY